MAPRFDVSGVAGALELSPPAARTADKPTRNPRGDGRTDADDASAAAEKLKAAKKARKKAAHKNKPSASKQLQEVDPPAETPSSPATASNAENHADNCASSTTPPRRRPRKKLNPSAPEFKLSAALPARRPLASVSSVSACSSSSADETYPRFVPRTHTDERKKDPATCIDDAFPRLTMGYLLSDSEKAGPEAIAGFWVMDADESVVIPGLDCVPPSDLAASARVVAVPWLPLD